MKTQGILRAGLDAAAALYAVRQILDLINRKLHGADLPAPLAVDASLPVYGEQIPAPAQCPLQCPHGAECAPGPGSEKYTEEDGDGGGDYAEGDKDHSNPIHYPLGPHQPEKHEAHQGDEYGDPDPHAAQKWGDRQLAAQRSQPEVDEAAPGTEVAAKPPPSEGGNDQKGGKYQQEDIAKLGKEDAADGHYQHYHAQIGRDSANFGLLHGGTIALSDIFALGILPENPQIRFVLNKI